MSNENNNFQDLKRLLKLKQHEIPPPGYFNRFSGDVMARIRAGETEQAESSVWANFLRIFEAKPGMIGGLATSLCLVLLGGVVFADRSDENSMGSGMAVSGGSGIPAGSPALAQTVALAPSGGSGITVTTNPIVSLQPMAAMFGSQQNPLFQTVGFGSANQ